MVHNRPVSTASPAPRRKPLSLAAVILTEPTRKMVRDENGMDGAKVSRKSTMPVPNNMKTYTFFRTLHATHSNKPMWQ